MNRKALFIALVSVVQFVAIGWLIFRYERVVNCGTEVRFACKAYDPYDPLRGRYLQTSVREVCTNFLFKVEDSDCYSSRRAYFARLEPADSNGLWRVSAVAETPDADGLWIKPKRVNIDYRLAFSEKAKDESYDAFGSRQKESGFQAEVVLPDQLFMNEKLAPKAENVLRENTGKSAVAVYRVWKNEIVITDIEVDGVSVGALSRDRESK